MNPKVLRYCPLQIDDILEGCRKIVGTGYTAQHYRPLIDSVLNRFFFLPDPDLLQTAQILFGASSEESIDVDNYITKEIVSRIQRSFGVIYPNRSYDWVFDSNLREILIREFSVPQEVITTKSITEEPNYDISDDYVPERLRSR